MVTGVIKEIGEIKELGIKELGEIKVLGTKEIGDKKELIEKMIGLKVTGEMPVTGVIKLIGVTKVTGITQEVGVLMLDIMVLIMQVVGAMLVFKPTGVTKVIGIKETKINGLNGAVKVGKIILKLINGKIGLLLLKPQLLGQCLLLKLHLLKVKVGPMLLLQLLYKPHQLLKPLLLTRLMLLGKLLKL